MPILTVPPVVPNGEYRICSADRSPELYLEWQSDFSIHSVPLKTENNDRQKWTITTQADGSYLIENVDSRASLSVRTVQEDGEERKVLFSGVRHNWTLEPRGIDFVIGDRDDSTCIDIATNNWLLLWERRNTRNQRWVLDSISGTTFVNFPLLPGIYHIRNRETNGQLSVLRGADRDLAPILVWRYEARNRTYAPRAWNVFPTGDGVRILNSQIPRFGPRSIRASTEEAVVGAEVNYCRLDPVAGTPYYHIAISTARDARVLTDPNPRDANDRAIATSDFNATDTRQHWEFLLAP